MTGATVTTTMARWRWPALGAALAAASLLLTIVDATAALGGWLVAFAFCSAVPIGALLLLMMMHLIPGSWSETLLAPARACSALSGFLPLAFLPVMIGLSALYPWANDSGDYLSPLFFYLRTLAFFGIVLALAWMVLTTARPGPVAAAGLVALVPLHTMIAVDWLMTLEPDFHSSGFGLYVLSIQMTIALCVLVAMHLATTRKARRVAMLGALLISALLCGIYFAFMQYFIIWSGNLPEGAAWYAKRGVGLWTAALYVSGALQMAPLLLLMFAPIRTDRRWLLALLAAVLLSKAIELAWIVLPALPANTGIASIAMVLALAGMGVLAAQTLPVATGLLDRLRRQAGEQS